MALTNYPMAFKEKVYVIGHAHSQGYWMVELKTLAFQHERDASKVAGELWKQRLVKRRWPDLKLDARKEIRIPTDRTIILHSPSPLFVQDVDLQALLEDLSKSEGALKLVPRVEEVGDAAPSENDMLVLSGPLLQVQADAADKAKWLQHVWKKRAERKD